MLEEPKVEPVEPEPEPKVEPVEPEPTTPPVEEPAPEPTLEDEIQLMNPQELKDFATRTLKDRREANVEAVKAKKEAAKSAADLAEIRTGQAKAKRDAELAGMEESDRLKAKLEDSLAETAKERSARIDAQVGNAIMSIATRLKFRDPADAVNNIDIQTVLVEGKLDRDALEEKVAALAESKPYFIQQPRKSNAFDAPAGPRTENPAPAIQGIENLTSMQNTKSKALASLQVRYQESLKKPGQEAALQSSILWGKMRDIDPDIGTGKKMDEALKADGRARRGD